MNKRILQLTFPNIITNITVPLLGMADLVIAGHLGNPVFIGAIAMGTTIFNFIYWNCGFLRMGTSGFAAQAFGANAPAEAVAVLVRGLLIAVTISTVIIALQNPVLKIFLHFIDGSNEMKHFTTQYFAVRVWAAPATLSLYCFKGWFVGMQNPRIPMFIAILMNVLNIAFSCFFVFVCQLNIAGVALGTVLAQYGGLSLAIIFWYRDYYHKYSMSWNWKKMVRWKKMKVFFKVNTDIFFRSLCLSCVFAYFPVAGAKIDDNTLAVNTLLLQFFTIFSYIMDGFAYAGESLAGRFIGAKDEHSLRQMIRLIFRWGLGVSTAFTIVYALWGTRLLILFTEHEQIVHLARQYYGWVLLVPLAGFAAFLWDGIYVGATASREMLISMLLATAVFFATCFLLEKTYPNNALWIALLLFLSSRSIIQTIFSRKCLKISETKVAWDTHKKIKDG